MPATRPPIASRLDQGTTSASGPGLERVAAGQGSEPAAADHAVTAPTAGREWFEGLYRRHADAVFAYGRRRTDDLQSAQDVLAETFLVAWRRRDAVPDDALPWLYAVAGHVLRNQRRGERRQLAVSDRLIREREWAVTSEEAGHEHGYDDDQGVLQALAALRPIDREALLLVAWEELDPARAARAAGCSRATFHVRLHRARKRFVQALAEHGHELPPAFCSTDEGHRA